MNFVDMDKAFLLQSEDSVSLKLGNIRYVPRSLDAADDAVSCADLRG